MKTLKEIAAAIDALPAEAFAGLGIGYADDIIRPAIERGHQRWFSSPEYAASGQRENERREARAAREKELARQRASLVDKWIENGLLKKGTFIKVLGARDGKGIREVIEVKNERLVCRKWLPVSPYKRLKEVKQGDLRRNGWRKAGDVVCYPTEYMTSHDFDKVSKLLG